MTRSSAVLVAAVVLVLVGVSIRFLWPEEPRSKPSALPGAPAAGPATPGPLPDPDGPVRREAQPHPSATGSGAVVLKGRVVDPEGRGLGAATIFTYGPPSGEARAATLRNETRPWSTVAADDDGWFDLPVPEASNLRSVLVCARAPHHRAACQEWPVAPVDAARSIVLGRGLEISGVVRDANGRPVAGLAILCTTDRRMGEDATLVSSGLLDRTAFQTPPPTWDGCEAETVSTADGSFRATGLSEGTYHVASASADWIVRPSIRTVAGTAGLQLVVLPRVGVEVRVTDETGRPVPSPEMDVSVTRFESTAAPLRYRRAGLGREGVAMVAWFDEPTWTRLALTCSVTAPGFEEGRIDAELEPTRPRTTVELRLRPRPQSSRPLFVRALVGGVRLLEGKCTFQFRSRTESNWAPLADRVSTTGHWFVDMPLVEGELRATLAGALACGVAWSTRWNPADNVESIAMDLPPHGTIVLRLAEEAAQRPYLLHLRRAGVDYSTSRSVRELVMPGMATGEWTIEVETRAGSLSQSVVVQDAGTHEVRLPNR